MGENDQATHASGKRSGNESGSGDHRMAQSRDRTVGEAGAESQDLEAREADRRRPRPNRRPPER